VNARIDHLVVGAADLEQGARWCERTFGIEPGPGGRHDFMGTHNRLLRVATVNHPRAYLEVIAADPAGRAPREHRRWFDLDDPALQSSLKASPQLIHWVVQVPDLRAALQAWRRLGIDRGEATTASRMTPRGPLQWQISIRPDGQRLFDGCLPTLIQWGDVHPVPGMPESGVTLQDLCVRHPHADELRRAFEAIELAVRVEEGPPLLRAVFQSPAGEVRLLSGNG
jgi:hypothetical protein